MPHLRDDETGREDGALTVVSAQIFLVAGHHGVVELLEECVVLFLAVGGGEAEGFDAFY